MQLVCCIIKLENSCGVNLKTPSVRKNWINVKIHASLMVCNKVMRKRANFVYIQITQYLYQRPD